jgi:carotenoid cleavage dioxygenase-like enzyme
METNFPWEIKFDTTPGKFTLESIDFDDFLGSLLDPIGAHPRVDREKQHLLNLAYDVNKGTCTYYRYDVNRTLMNKVEINTATPRMVHDL